ncbi:hypothetical protein CesoFtcFv8_026021 [Champsocephalus esox]|uniref:Uncharacterized protein n=2 Tax=Champsocephalus TaxID=52236 RepID=A0AAN8C1N2_CHAGU|nr:hypothetical protein CesoFtcFv8_026021 [Champsocephalus esox]KAK5895891.1 hypothetical protein CgunFtcFv8_009547 [Champsocephalus gunnari]
MFRIYSQRDPSLSSVHPELQVSRAAAAAPQSRLDHRGAGSHTGPGAASLPGSASRSAGADDVKRLPTVYIGGL